LCEPLSFAVNVNDPENGRKDLKQHLGLILGFIKDR
jgi:hypothetical protein